MDVTFDAPVGELPVPTREGYTFNGWIDRMGNVYTAETIYNVTGDTFLIAVWVANEYTITLDANGGELETETLTVTFGEVIGELPVPTREGFNFVGWFDAEGNEVLAEDLYKVAVDVTLTAKWESTNNPPPTGDISSTYLLIAMVAMATSAAALLLIKRKEQF
jgi:uncharacterized repeat protein (TIGR02543 family)/LPXTG-motif cell wall-anchored protein